MKVLGRKIAEDASSKKFSQADLSSVDAFRILTKSNGETYQIERHIDPKEVEKARVVMTIMDGRVVYEGH